MKSIFSCYVLSCFVIGSLGSSLQAEVNEPIYSMINPIDFNKDGWANDAYMVPSLIEKLNAKVIVEIGSWMGASSRVIAKALPQDATMICIDHWMGSFEHHVQHGQDFFDNLFPTFISNTKHAGFAKKIQPLRLSSIDAANAFDIPIDLLYLDGSHETEAVYADLKAWWPKLRDGGILCGDDWPWPSVRAAIERFAKENGLIVHARGDFNAFWYIDPKNRNGKAIRPLPPNDVTLTSIYSLVKTLPIQEIDQCELTNQVIDCIENYHPDSLVLVEPKNSVSICQLGKTMQTLGKVFLVECFEFVGDNVNTNYDIHPFHQHLSNIKQSGLTNVVVPVQMFSIQAAQSVHIRSPMIYVNLVGCSGDVVSNLGAWQAHLAENGILCGSCSNKGYEREALEEFAHNNGYVLETKDSGFWTMR